MMRGRARAAAVLRGETDIRANKTRPAVKAARAATQQILCALVSLIEEGSQAYSLLAQ